jgi:hypothetical protein
MIAQGAYMAFCNACGANIAEGAGFCGKCGAAQLGETGPRRAPTFPAGEPTGGPTLGAPTPHGNTLKPLLIALGIILVIAGVAIAALTIIGLQIARQTRVRNRDGNVRIESPFGTVETTNNPVDLGRQLGVDVYPNAQVLRGKVANINVAGMHTVAAEFETNDPPDKVADFYKSKLPNATVSVSGEDHCSIVSTEKNNLVTINIEPHGAGTWIKVANISGKGVGGSSD